MSKGNSSNMSFSYTKKISDWDVKIIVISRESDLSDGLIELLSSFDLSTDTKRVVGLDTASTNNKAVLLNLSTGSCCLIIRLDKFDVPLPNALANFMLLSDVSFAGVNIKFCVDLLERNYGLRIRNSVDLGQLAAAVREKKQLSHCGLADMASSICFVTLSVKPPSVILGSWTAPTLSDEQIESATTDAFVSFLVGNQLLGGFDPAKSSSGYSCGYYD